MKKYITMYLLRHGETAMNRKGITQGARATRLTSLGLKQAKRAASLLGKKTLTVAYSSPIFRTMQTARIVCRHNKMKIIKLPVFGERNYGILVGRNEKQIMKLIPNIKEQWKRDGVDWRPCRKSESIRDAYQRVVAGFNHLIKKHKAGESVLIVTHGGVIKCLLMYFNKKGPEHYFKVAPVNHCEVIEVLWNRKPLRIRCLLK